MNENTPRIPKELAYYDFGKDIDLSLEEAKTKLKNLRLEIKKHSRNSPMWKLYYKECCKACRLIRWLKAPEN